MSANHCNCPNCQTVDCPAGMDHARIEHRLEQSQAHAARLEAVFEVVRIYMGYAEGSYISEAKFELIMKQDTSTALAELLGPTVEWIKKFPCPECDGSGAKHLGFGEVAQCQFCHERQLELARLRALLERKA